MEQLILLYQTEFEKQKKVSKNCISSSKFLLKDFSKNWDN